MVTFFASVLVVAAFAVIVRLPAPRTGGRAAGLLERYPPAADWSPSSRDDQRQYADLIAAAAHRDRGAEVEPRPGRPFGRRRRAVG